jgi:putative phosphoesterase
MHYLIVSDSHDNHANLQLAIDQAKLRGITQAIHLGDLCSPPIAKRMSESGLHWFLIWGNCDGDKLNCQQQTAASGMVDMVTTEYRELTLDGKSVFLTHYPLLAEHAAESGRYDAVFYGHNHLRSQAMVGETLFANPGEICANKTGIISYGVYDSDTNTFELVEITG